jgi:disulfide bond formation protein DsbB
MNNSAYTTREFTYPALTKIALLVVLPVMLIAVLLSSGENISLAIVLAGTFLAIFLYVFFQMTGKIRVEPTGLVLTRPLRETVSLPWQEIASVSSNWTDTSIRVKDAMGGRKIAFTLMLNGFQEVVDEIYTHRPDLFAVNPGQEFGVGALRWLQVAFLALLLLLFVYVSFFTDNSESIWLGLIFLGIMGISLVAFVFVRPFKVTFEHDRMLAKAVFGTREIQRNAVLDARLTVTGGRSRTLLVRVDYHDAAAGKDKHVDLTGFACGSPRLYGAIRSWAGITQKDKLSAYKEAFSL